MGACINPKPKQKNGNQPKIDNKSKIKGSREIDGVVGGGDGGKFFKDKTQASPRRQIPQKPRMRKTTGQQFVAAYRIQQNIGLTARAEGPKYISNFSDGSGKILRVVPFVSISSEQTEQRIRLYGQLCRLEVLEDDQSNLLILQDYYSGPTLDQMSSSGNREHIEKFLLGVYDIISKFHEKNIVLGNINVFSFRQTSEYDATPQLVDLNLFGGTEEAMGHAHKAEKGMDWEAFGYMVQLVLGRDPPIFIPHKIQYMEASNMVVNQLLKGKKIPRQKLQGLEYQAPNQAVVAGYKYRLDVAKLLKLRKRRTGHRQLYYSEQVMQDGKKLHEDLLHRVETSRILERIDGYADSITSSSEEAFMMYTDANDKLKKLKQTFLAKEKERKLVELKETLPLLK